jgi:AmmeMemoRadiSam system protein A
MPLPRQYGDYPLRGYRMKLSADEQAALLELARVAIRAALVGALEPAIPEIPALGQPAGCFVTLHELRSHRLRGCVGRLDAKAPLGKTVVKMAQAVLEDPRFLNDPVTLSELADLEIELSILSPLIPAENTADFDLLQDGIYLTCGDRSGCFLPQVARETGWSKEQLLDRLCSEKMDLVASSWRDPDSRLFRFTTLVIGPVPFVPH